MYLKPCFKFCPQCKTDKSVDDFGKSKTKPDGLRYQCKECRKKDYYDNHEKSKEAKRLDYERHKEARKQKMNDSYKQNPEKFINKSKKYYEENRDQINLKSKIYKENNRDKVLKRKRESEQKQRDDKKQKKIDYQNSLITVNYPAEYRICSCCKTLKFIENNFNFLKGKRFMNKKSRRAFCVECESFKHKDYRKRNGDILRMREREERKNNPEKYKEQGKKHRQSESYKKRCSLPKYRIFRNISQYIKTILSNHGLSKNGKSKMLYINCTKDFFYSYVELQFKPGMTWDNYGNKSNNWSLDHFLPKEAFNILNQQEQDICLNWRNCQPMWHTENESKQDKMPNGEFARNTKQNYTLQDKIDLINKRLVPLDISHLIDDKDKFWPNIEVKSEILV
jgi:CMP-N-acetylneuraminic acid synthetase